jgi:hypothetical protein
VAPQVEGVEENVCAQQVVTGGWRKPHMSFHGSYTSPKMFSAKVKIEMG